MTFVPKAPATFKPSHQKPRDEARRAFDARRAAEQPWRRWYKWPVWVRGIRPAQLAAQPLCERCLARGDVVPATVVNHKGGHGGVWERFIAGPFESVCKACHDGEVAREERGEG